MQVWCRERGEDHREVQHTSHEVPAHLGREIRLDVEGAIGQFAAEPQHPVAEMPRCQIALDAKTDIDHGLAPGGHRMAGLGPGVAQRARMGDEFQTLGRQVRSGTRTREKPDAERGFERCDPARNGGLRQPLAIRRAVETTGFAEIEEGFDLVWLHDGLSLIGYSDQ